MLEKARSQQRQSFNAYDRPHDDLREFIARAERAGEIVRIRGADWKLEMGTLAEIVNHARPEPPAILFEDVPGYPSGHAASFRRDQFLQAAGDHARAAGAGQSARRGARLSRPHEDAPADPAEDGGDGPVLENVDRDDEVDVLKFPVPFLHEHDGGRYIGTDDLVIMRDPEENWVNCATYRAMVQDKNHVSLWISPGKHGRQIREKYFRAGKPCPVLISCGHDPLLFLAGGNELKLGLSEYDYAGGHRGEPYEVVQSEIHGLPMPAHAEIVLEGEMVEGDEGEGRTVRRVHRLLRVEPERAAGGARQARLSPQRSDPRHRLADAAAVGLLVLQVRDEGRHDLGRGRARGTFRRRRRVGARVRRRAHVQRHRHQAGLSRPRPPGRPARGQLPVGVLSRPLRGGGGRGRRSLPTCST